MLDWDIINYLDLQSIEKVEDFSKEDKSLSLIPNSAIEKTHSENNKHEQIEEISNKVELPTPFENKELSKLFNFGIRSSKGKDSLDLNTLQ